MKKIFIVTVLLALVLAGCSLGGEKEAVISMEEASTKAADFINENLMQPGSTVTVKEVVEEGNLYKITVSLPGDQSQDIDSYMTKDGKKFFPQAFEMDKEDSDAQADANADAQTDANTQNTPASASKSDKPKVELFVMSHCPYGTQIEKGIIPAVQALGDKIDFELKFCDYAMHGEIELDEQLQQYCVQKETPDKLLSYLNCFLADGDTSDSCFQKAGIDKSKIDSCVAATDKQYKVTENFNDKSTYKGRFPTFNIFKAEVTKYGVSGSPTLVINGAKASSGRDAASLLKAICSNFNNPPEECNKTLSSASPSPGFGTGTSGGGSAGSCN
jgi:glutaredoxin